MSIIRSRLKTQAGYTDQLIIKSSITFYLQTNQVSSNLSFPELDLSAKVHTIKRLLSFPPNRPRAPDVQAASPEQAVLPQLRSAFAASYLKHRYQCNFISLKNYTQKFKSEWAPNIQ